MRQGLIPGDHTTNTRTPLIYKLCSSISALSRRPVVCRKHVCTDSLVTVRRVDFPAPIILSIGAWTTINLDISQNRSIRINKAELGVALTYMLFVSRCLKRLQWELRRSLSTMALTEVSSNKMFGGYQKVFSHESTEVKCTMKFGVFLPPQAESGKCPVLYWLSGLTCTEQNFVTKAGAQRVAAELGFVIVAPDTSPRGCNIEGEEDGWDFGTGAGFYVDATQDKWKNNYRMYSYVTKELPDLVNSKFPVLADKQGIFGHSMGGHGALICALKNPGKYLSVSAFAPICNPVNCPWGKKAFSGYLGENQEDWKEYDSCCLVKKYNGPPLKILVDQGKADNFLPAGQLLPDNFVTACAEAKMELVMRMQEGYDHSYYFMATFMEDHLRHHAKFLK